MGLALGALLGQVLVDPRPIRRRKETYLFVAAAAILLALGFALQKTRGYVSLLNRASRAIEQHRLNDASKDLEQVVAHNPKNTMALVLLGNVYLQQKDYPRAESTLKKAAATDPGNLGVQYNLGLLYESTGRFEEARVIFDKLTAKDPDDDAAWVLLGSRPGRPRSRSRRYRRLYESHRRKPEERRSLPRTRPRPIKIAEVG